MILRSVPWWTKIILKMVISVFPISYEKIRSIVTGYNGEMADANYAERIFLGHYENFSNLDNKPGAFLELGPGGSLISGVLAISHGFERAILIDVGDFASKDVELYKSICQKYLPNKLKVFLDDYELTHDVFSSLRACGIYYEYDGLSSLKKLDSNQVEFSFSNAVLEHIRLDEFSETIDQLGRVHKPGSVSSHRIDFKDHLGGGLNNLRFSRVVWESRYFLNSGFYTNRLRYKDVRDICLRSGFEVSYEQIEKWDNLPLQVEKFAREFQHYEEEELLVSGANLVLKKP